MDNKDVIICSCGCVCSAKQKFCGDCGAKLIKTDPNTSQAKVNSPNFAPTQILGAPNLYSAQKYGFVNPIQMQMPTAANAEPVNVFPDDKGLKLLADVCHKSGPLPMGQSYDESVLYYDEKTDSYQVHLYASNFFGEEMHKGYFATKEQADAVMKAIDIKPLRDSLNFPVPVGGSRIIKFVNDEGKIERFECSTSESYKVANSVGAAMGAAVQKKNRIVPEYAKNWEKCAVSSTGPSMDNCFSYFLERTSDGTVKIHGSTFVSGSKLEISEQESLNEAEKEELADIPLGLMLSNISPKKNTPQMTGYAGTLDGRESSCTITYQGGKTDTKYTDNEMISDLDALMKKVFSRLCK